MQTNDVLENRVDKLQAQLAEVKRTQQNSRVNYEAKFKTIELIYKNFNGNVSTRIIEKPGKIVDMKDTDYLLIVWEDGSVTGIDKHSVDQFNLDRKEEL